VDREAERFCNSVGLFVAEDESGGGVFLLSDFESCTVKAEWHGRACPDSKADWRIGIAGFVYGAANGGYQRRAVVLGYRSYFPAAGRRLLGALREGRQEQQQQQQQHRDQEQEL